tara:strand:- start:287 stop:925 length:639 start_codon:yes stop_codon:yes gene_type:complete
MINDIDIEWLDEFDKYDIFYKDKNYDINFTYIYTSRPTHAQQAQQQAQQQSQALPVPEIYKIKKELIKLNKENIISKEELVFNINKNKEDTKLISICLYNNKDDINNIKSNNIITNPNDLIKEINYLEDIIIEDTINYLKNLNSIIIIFYKKNYKYINLDNSYKIISDNEITENRSINKRSINKRKTLIKKINSKNKIGNNTRKIKMKEDKD